MEHRLNFRRTIALCLLFVGSLLANLPIAHGQSNWENLAPGAGGQVQDLYFDPHVEGRIWLSSDQEGSYRSDDLGQSWTFIGRDFSHGMSFIIRKSNDPSGRIYQGGLWGAHYSDDGGSSWTRIETTRADAIAAIAISPDDQTVVLAPSWHTKDPQKIQASISDPVQPLTGERYVYISTDGGNSFTTSTYEPVEGYDQAYEAYIHPTTGIIYLGAASGVYYSTDPAGTSWVRADNPTDAYRGEDGGINTTTVRRDDGTINPNGYRLSGGCTGIGFSPEGDRIYAVFQTGEQAWAVYTTPTDQLSANNPNWELVSNNLPAVPQWHIPVVDPRSTATEHKILLGTVFLGRDNRVGLYQGTIALDGSNNIASNDWQQIIRKPDGETFTYEEGWETASLISRSYQYTPLSWSERRIITSGGNNYFLSTDPSAPGWPFNEDSWLPIYTNKATESFGPVHTYFSTGFTNTVSYDIATHESYAVQGNADQGVLESWDFGKSWSKETVPRGITNSQSVTIAQTSPPIVLVDSRPGFGITSKTIGRLYARQLTNPGQQPEVNDWQLIGGGTDNSNIVAGLPNRQIQDIALDEHHPSRVYLGLRTEFGVGGIYATEELEAVYEGRADWVEISSPDMSNVPTFNDLFVDPNDADVLWAAGNKLYKGTRSAPYTWTWEEFDTNVQDMYVWDDGGTTRVAVAAVIDETVEVYLLENPAQPGWNTESRFVGTGLTIDQTLAIRPQVWVEPMETITFGLMAGYQDQILVGTENTRHKKGLGVFRGTISNDGTVSWEDYSEDDSGMDFIYSRDNSADSKVIRETDGEVYYYVPTFGTGVWRRLLETNTPDPAFTVDRSSLRLTEESGDSQEVTITTSDAWSISNLPGWLSVNTTSGSGNTTLTFTTSQENTEPGTRRAQVKITSGSKEIELLATQVGTPIPLNYVSQEISVDGLQDEVWGNVPWQNIEVNLFGTTPDSKDRFKIAYTRDRLYLLVRVQDSSPNFQQQGDTLYVGDGIKVGLDIDNGKKSFYDVSDYLFDVQPTGNVEAVTDNVGNIVSAEVNNISGGYVYEVGIAWSDLNTIPTDEALLGLEIRVADNQSGNGVSQTNQWFSDQDLSTSNPAAWGNARLQGPDIPWFEAFDLAPGSTGDTGPTAWTIDFSGATLSDENDYFRVIGGGIVEARDLDGEAVFRSEAIDISTVDQVSVSVEAKERGENVRDDDGNYVKLFISVDGGAETLVDQLVGDAPEDNTFITLSGNGFSGSTLEVIVKVANDRGGTFHTIDDVLVDVGSQENCGVPNNPTVETLESTRATLAWKASLDGLVAFEVQVRPTGTAEWRSVTVENTNSATVENLSAETEYEWRVRQNCLTLSSSWVAGESFTTLEPINLITIFRETFDAAGCSPVGSAAIAAYNCYSDSTAVYSGTATFSNNLNNLNNADYEAASNGYHIFLNDSLQTFAATGINTTGFTNTVLRFGIRKNGNNQNGSELRLEVTQNGADWSTVPVSLPTGEGTSSVWYLRIPGDVPITQTTDFGIRFTAAGSANYRIDDIEVLGEEIGSVVCDAPQNLEASRVGIASADVAWSSIATASQGYDIRLRPTGATTWSVESTISESRFTFGGLAENVTYEWQVRARCSAGTTSEWSSAQLTTSEVQAVVLMRETHDQSGCAPTSFSVDNYNCYSATTVSHSGTGIINNNLDNADYPGASNNNHVFLDAAGEVYEIIGIDATGYQDLSVAFGVRKNGKFEDGTNLRVEVTNDGTTWQDVPINLPTGDGTNSVWYRVRVDANVLASATVGIRFTTLGNPKFRIDDVTLEGFDESNARANSVVLFWQDEQDEEKSRTKASLNAQASRYEGTTKPITFYPNEVKDQLHVQFTNPDISSDVYVYDLNGRLVYHTTHSATRKPSLVINTTDWPNKVYLMRVITAEGNVGTYRVVKK